MTVFGPIVTGDDVEAATETTLKLWMPTYIAELERVTGRDPGSIQAPRSYLINNRFERRPEDQFPACVIVSTGTVGTPERRGDGDIMAWFRIEVGIAASARTREESNQLAKLYAAAIRTLLLQKPSLGGFANAVTYEGESYDDLPSSILDVGAYALVLANVQVASISSTDGGPSFPDLDPADWPDVDEVNVTIQREGVTA